MCTYTIYCIQNTIHICTFQTICTTQRSQSLLYSHCPWCLLFPGSKSITKRWLFKVVWPKGHDLLELRQVSPMWEDSHYRNPLSNFCGPKLWTTPPKKKIAISGENSWNYHTLQNFCQNCWFDKFTNLQNRIQKDRSGTPPFGPTNWHLTQWILQVAQPSTAFFHQYGVQGLLITAVRRSLDGECSFPKNKKQMCHYETI